MVLLYWVTAKVRLPVGFDFYPPDPAMAAWKKTDEALKKQGAKKAARPAKPVPNPACPSKLDILINRLRELAFYHPTVRVKAVLADAWYGSAGWMNRVIAQFPKTQVISQLQKTQKVRFRQRTLTVAQYFATHPGVAHTLRLGRSLQRNSVITGFP